MSIWSSRTLCVGYGQNKLNVQPVLIREMDEHVVRAGSYQRYMF